MKGQTEKKVICPECGEYVTEEDRKKNNIRYTDDGKIIGHEKCRLIRK